VIAKASRCASILRPKNVSKVFARLKSAGLRYFSNGKIGIAQQIFSGRDSLFK
jgi:hypothetical protein